MLFAVIRMKESVTAIVISKVVFFVILIMIAG
jgi:hypothetical protein